VFPKMCKKGAEWSSGSTGFRKEEDGNLAVSVSMISTSFILTKFVDDVRQ